MIDYLTRENIMWLFEIEEHTFNKWLRHPNFPTANYSPWALPPYDCLYDGDAVMTFYEETGKDIL